MVCFLSVVEGKRLFYGTVSIMGKPVVFSSTERGGEIIDIIGNSINKLGCFEPFEDTELLREVAQKSLDQQLGIVRKHIINQ